MNSFLFVGVDIAKSKFDAQILISDKKMHKQFDNTSSGFRLFLKWISKHHQPLWVGMESTGHYSEPLADFLFHQNIKVSVINPLQIKHFAKSKLTRNKNDILDARIIADFVQTMQPKSYVPRSEAQKQLREWVRVLEGHKSHIVACNNLLESTKDKAVRKHLKHNISLLTKLVKKIEANLKAQIQEDNDLADKVRIIESIKGVGFLTAIYLLAYLPDITLFKNAKQLAAFFGLTPRQRESGQYRGKTCLSKYGNPAVRKALFMPALSVKRSNRALKPFITRLENNGLKPKAIVGAIMRKLIHVIYGMLKSGQEFNPELC